MSDPNENGGVSVTIKFPESEKFAADNPWIVFHGSVERITEDIVKAFGLSGTEDLSLSDLALEAQAIASATGKLANSAGGRSIASKSSSSSEAKPDEPAKDPVLAAIDGLESTTDHRNLWADEKDSINSKPEYVEAWKAKGRELRDAGA